MTQFCDTRHKVVNASGPSERVVKTQEYLAPPVAVSQIAFGKYSGVSKSRTVIQNLLELDSGSCAKFPS